MANPVNNSGINANVNLGGALKAQIKTGGAAGVSETQSREAIRNVNENLAKNPNHAPPVGRATDARETPQNQSNAGDGSTAPPKEAQEDHAAPPRANEPNDLAETGEDANLLNRGQRGEPGKANASETGQAHGRGHHKVPYQTGDTPPIIVFPDEPGNGNPKTGGTQNTPPIVVFPPGQGNQPNGNGQNLPPVFNIPNTNLPVNQPPMGVNYSVELNLRAHGNQPYGVIRRVVAQVLQQNDVYLSRPALNRLINHQTLQNNAPLPPANLPREIGSLIQNVARNTMSLLDTSRQNHKFIHQLSKEIAHQLRADIQDAKHAFLKNADLGAVHFRQLNLPEKMLVAIERLPAHLPPPALADLQNHRSQDVLSGLLLARGFVVPNGQAAEIRNLVSQKTAILPPGISITGLRDFGNLVKVLIADTAAAKTTVNLDLAVGKFVKILLANNELGVLLATVSLASQTGNQGGLISRTLALAQIYELINRLIRAGETALREAAPEASKTSLQKEKNTLHPAGLPPADEANEAKFQLNKTANEAAAALRQFLEFNPALQFDNSASAFHDPADARQAQKDFVDLYHDDIAAWLESGKHRFVKDFDFGKPVGVVVERASEQIFTVNSARFVLVRDGSVEGWHFLKSFLVK